MPLSPQEAQELQSLEGEVGHLAPPQQTGFADFFNGNYKRPTAEEAHSNLERTKATPESAKQVLNAVAGSFMPAATINPLRGLTTAVGDRVMQAATGIKKYIPGLGTDLVDQGIVGTKGMMKSQIAKKIGNESANLDQAVSQIPSRIAQEPVAKAVDSMASKYATEGGIVPEAVRPEFNKVSSTVEDIIGRGEVSPQEALKLKRIAQGIGYKNGQPLAALESKLAQTEAGAYGRELEKGYAQANPEAPNAVEQANAKLSTLLKGQKGLNTPESVKRPLIGLKDIIAGSIGTAAAGPGLGTAAGIAAGKFAQTPLGSSMGAHALIRGGRVAGQASLMGAGRLGENQANSLMSPSEQDELSKLEQEVGHLAPK